MVGKGRQRGEGRKGSRQELQPCTGPEVRGAWPLLERMKEGQRGWRLEHPEGSCGTGEGAVGHQAGPGAWEGV